MLKRLLVLVLLVMTGACTPRAAGFDYYLLSLSWSPEYCAQTQRGGEPQCTRPYAFVAHGLWPQNERGYPRDCPDAGRVSEATIERMLPIMPSRGLVIHEWRTHGACSGLGAEAYFDTVERAYRSILIPAAYQAPETAISITSTGLKQAFVDANPGIPPDAMSLECRGNDLQERRICMDRSRGPRRCGTDVQDRGGASGIVLRPVR